MPKLLLTMQHLNVMSSLVYSCELYLTFSELFDIKAKYDESDNLFIRGTRTFTDKLSELFGMSST